VADDEDTGSESQEGEGLEARVSGLEAGQQGLAGKIDQILGIIQGGGGRQPEAKAPAPAGNVADEIRQQLDLIDREKKGRDEIEGLKTKVAELSETPPEPQPRRVEKFMWGAQ
jgi:hypothetical protein